MPLLRLTLEVKEVLSVDMAVKVLDESLGKVVTYKIEGWKSYKG